MSDLLRSTRRTATRTLKNPCFLCCTPIRVGQPYLAGAFADGGTVFSIYEHAACNRLFTDYMNNWYGPYYEWEYDRGALREIREDLLETNIAEEDREWLESGVCSVG